jgi:CNT family concentrative nucleoside transporter
MDETLWLRGISALGLALFVGLAWLLSERREEIPWRLVAWAMLLQFILAVAVLKTYFGYWFFEGVRRGFDILDKASKEGAQFLFGNLTDFFFVTQVRPSGDSVETVGPIAINAVVAFKVLPVIIFVSGLAAILQHFGIIQAFVRGFAWCMQRTLKTSGAETFGAALLVFMGIESMSALTAYLKDMTRSELFTLMCAFLATIATSVMVAYAGFGAQPGHLLAASLMSAPAAIAFAKIMIPEQGTPLTLGTTAVHIPRETQNAFDAAAYGAHLGLHMALNVGALLIVFIGLIYLLNAASTAVLGQPITVLLAYVFRPFAWAMGVPWRDIAPFSELLATKSFFNEFLAYQRMQGFIENHVMTDRSISIATYALCGFSNPGSLGILIGGMAAIAPERRNEIAAMSLKAFVGGTLACFCTASIAGILL